MFLAPWSRNRLKKKPGAGAALKVRSQAGAAKKLPAPQPCEKIKSIRKLYFSYSSLSKIVSFMIKKTIILLVLYFLQFYLTSLRGKEYFPNLNNSHEPEPVGAGCFGSIEPEPLEKKKEPEPEPLGEKNQPLKNLPAPQP